MGGETSGAALGNVRYLACAYALVYLLNRQNRVQ